MAINLLRVTHKQVLRPGISRNGSILLDKIDESLGNENTSHALVRKQKVYVPFADPLTPAFAGYLDFVQTDNVKLAAENPKGVIAGLVARGHVDAVIVASNLIATPVVTNAVATAGDVVLTGTTFLSVLPTLTSVILTPPGLAPITVPQANFVPGFTGTSLQILDANIPGTIVAGWTAQVFANNKLSNVFTVV